MSATLEFTFDWFSGNIARWRELLGNLVGRPNLRFLEIGSFEGRVTVWLLENVLTHHGSTIDCVDSFGGSPELDAMGVNWQAVEQRFHSNIRVMGSQAKVRLLKGRSQQILRRLESDSYDFVYVDRSHKAPDVLEDAVLAFALLKPGGMMIFDDYGWDAAPTELERPRLAIDCFLLLYQGKYQLVSQEYQVVIQKR